MALVGIELETLVSEPDALTTRPPPCAEFNRFFENVGSWYEQRHQPNVLFLLYEDLKRDLRGNILKIARFLGPHYENVINANNEEILEKILENSSFKSMKKKTTQWVRILLTLLQMLKL